MKANNLFHISVMTAITETQKALNQRYAVTGETFDPFKSDAQDFTLRHRKKTDKLYQSDHMSQSAASKQEIFSGEGPTPTEEKVRTEPMSPPITSIENMSGAVCNEKHSERVGRLNAAELRHAVILSEIIGPPVSRRGGR